MLYAPALDTRLQAAILVRATPYVGAVAAAVAAELARPSAIVEPVLAGSLLATLRTIGGAEQRPLVERLVLTTGVPAPVALAAAHAVAHVGGQSPTRSGWAPWPGTASSGAGEVTPEALRRCGHWCTRSASPQPAAAHPGAHGPSGAGSGTRRRRVVVAPPGPPARRHRIGRPDARMQLGRGPG